MDTDQESLRRDAARRSGWNVGYFAAGFVFWTYAAIIGERYPLETARHFLLVGTFLIFPVAVAASRIFGVDPFGKGNPLTELVGYTHMSVIALTFPIIIATLIYFPEMLVLVMAIAYCIDFYVMSWAFGTRLFGLHAALRTIVASLVWFAAPDARAVLLPAIIAAFYLATLLAIPVLRQLQRS